MSMPNFVKAILIAELFAVATYALGWWTVPLIAAAWGFVSRDANAARYTALCAMAGWVTLLLLDAAKGPVASMAARLGGVMGIPAVLLYVLTLLFPALLAWSAAKLSAGLFLRRPVG
ncbi:MAG TPA: hypothetical protein VKO87_07200 [Gemmatimonadaceae bacterium]|nr:hypothetical protein [Gemmatimonadaceae bacterium]